MNISTFFCKSFLKICPFISIIEIISFAQYLHIAIYMELAQSKIGAGLLRQILRCREIDKHLSEKAELTVDEMHCLGVLYIERPMCAKNLSELLGLSATRTSKILLSLDRRGSVTRAMDSADHRKEQIMLTEKGRETAEMILSLYTEIGNRLNLYGESAMNFSWLMRDSLHSGHQVESD